MQVEPRCELFLIKFMPNNPNYMLMQLFSPKSFSDTKNHMKKDVGDFRNQ